MFKDEAEFLAALPSDDHRTFYATTLKTATEGAVTKFKTESEEARKKLVPEKYEFKFKEESPLDPSEDAVKIADYAKSRGFTAEDAQTLADLIQDRAIALTQRQQAITSREVEGWKSEWPKDKDLGGPNLKATEANLKRAMDRFAKPGTDERKFLEESGIIHHPKLVKIFNSIGKAMSEGGHIPGSEGGGGAEPASLAEALYGKKTA